MKPDRFGFVGHPFTLARTGEGGVDATHEIVVAEGALGAARPAPVDAALTTSRRSRSTSGRA
jgi:hypothetical protein